MTIPKKGRSDITVDGTHYHFKIAFNRSERVVIQHASGHGACLFVFPHAIMKPSHVADAIRFGLSRGWPPGKTSEDHWIAFDLDVHEKAVFEFIPTDDFRVVTYATHGELPNGVDGKTFADTRMWWDREINPDS